MLREPHCDVASPTAQSLDELPSLTTADEHGLNVRPLLAEVIPEEPDAVDFVFWAGALVRPRQRRRRSLPPRLQ